MSQGLQSQELKLQQSQIPSIPQSQSIPQHFSSQQAHAISASIQQQQIVYYISQVSDPLSSLELFSSSY